MDPKIEAVQGAQLPVMPPDVVDLIHMIDDEKSHDVLFSQLSSSTLVTNAAPSNVCTNESYVLFHAIPLPLLRSLLMGTLGPHFYSKDAKKDNWATLYDDNCAGAYAACLHIQHRKGAFLSQRETRELISALKMYALGVRLYDDHYEQGVRVWLAGDQAALEFTQIIDDELRTTKHWDKTRSDRYNYMERPRFAQSETPKIGSPSTADGNIKSLICMFENRCTIDETDATNPELDVPQLQSPIMVGNSGYMRARLINHLIDDHGTGASTAKVFALTKSCLHHMGLQVESLAIPIVVAWTEPQIDHAEILGTVLANSRLPGHGYNAKVPGTRGTRPQSTRLDHGKEHLFAWKPFLKENLKRTLQDIRERIVAEDKANLLAKLANIRNHLKEIQVLRRQYKEEVEEICAKHEEAIEAAEQEIKELKTAYTELSKLKNEHDALIKIIEEGEGQGE
ncbi:hypothetical protein GGS24DRAFT_483241 [Hypoxylon argillaceum]|nr:hypothetical protein GGS24DRAFT_483241 [Hypoxylon argillaceum]KAI1145814.1 hypothetical protein F4825DRAFT_473446 [Nemania diffusa]